MGGEKDVEIREKGFHSNMYGGYPNHYPSQQGGYAQMPPFGYPPPSKYGYSHTVHDSYGCPPAQAPYGCPPPVIYPPHRHHGYEPGGMGGFLAGGVAASAGMYGTHHLAHGHGGNFHHAHGSYHGHGYGYGHHRRHGKFKHGKFKHGKFGKHGKFRKWK